MNDQPKDKPSANAGDSGSTSPGPNYEKILKANPDNPQGLMLVGMQAVRDKRFADAEGFFRRATEVTPDDDQAWNLLGMTLRKLNRRDEAIACFERVVGLQGTETMTLMQMTGDLFTKGRIEEAIAAVREAIRRAPSHAGCHMAHGHMLKELGYFDQAVIAYRNVVRLVPGYGEGYWSLANLKTYRFEAAEIGAMEAALKRPDIKPDDAVALLFSLGKAHEDKGELDRAFSYYQAANARKRDLVGYDAAATERLTDRLIEVCTADFFAERRGWGHDDGTVIFIVGLPRSGSTLIEQMLASHSAVEGAGELPYLAEIATSVGGPDGSIAAYPGKLAEVSAERAAALGEDYLARVRTHRTDRDYVIDKMPNNFAHVGLLQLIMPSAKIIDARRDPLDSCFGTYKQLFAEQQEFSYSFDDLAHYYIQYDRLMAHWDEVLPGKALRVDYEDVVADLEGQARRILAHCGLEFEDQVLKFWQTSRAVKSASSEQVRKPIYASSLHGWRKFESHLKPLIDALGPVLQK